MSVESVRTFFEEKGADIPIIKMSERTATVAEAAEALGVDPDEIAKTLSFRLSGQVILIVASGSARVDNRKYRETFGEKARMLGHDEVEAETGHPVGGTCPFGVKPGVGIYLDRSLQKHETVYPAAGSRYDIVRLTTGELAALTGGQWVDVCKEAE